MKQLLLPEMDPKYVALTLVFFFLLPFSPITMSIAQSLNTDESTLVHFRSLISLDPNNILSTNWSQGTSFCTWIGVICSPRHQRVVSLNLFDFKLTGTISPQIGNLSFLTYLDLGNNSFTGQIPDTIGNLFRLRELRMSFNMLSGNVPTSLEMLRNLEILDLSYNNLIGNVPWGIFNISSMRDILLMRNGGLSGVLPSEICTRPTRLQRIRITGNQFSGEIPRGLPNCVELRFVYMSFNNFTGNIPEDIGNLSQLQILALGRNQLTGTIPLSVGNMSNLGTLDLSQNNLDGIVPLELGNLSNLTLLSLGDNMLNGELPSSVFNLTRLQLISLTMNQLTGSFPSSIDVMLPNIQEMYFGMNMFSGEISNTFSNLSHLISFDLGYNSFTGLIPINLGNLRNLRIFRMGNNHFTNDLSVPHQEFLTSLLNCKSLTHIVIESNPITGVLPISIGNMSTSLEYFMAGNCSIEGTIPIEIGNLNNLLWLHIGRNNFTGEIPTTLGNLINLQRLSLYENDLHGSLPESLCKLENLFSVDIGRNMLSGQIPMCLGNLNSLRELFLYANSFNSTIPSTIWQNRRIQVISLWRNLFYGSLPNQIGNLDNLQRLSLDENQLSGNIPVTIGELRSLTFLELQNNRFNDSIPSSLSNLIDLQHLDLSQNNLSGLIPMSLENLMYLDYFNVSFNALQGEIPIGGSFANFTRAFFMHNRGLCGASQFGVEACQTNRAKPSKHNKRLLIYILPPLCLAILLVVINLLVRSYGRISTISSSHPDSHLGNTHERISYYEILRATNSFDIKNLVGKGSIGSVYKGTFSNGMVAAVKVFNLEVQGAFRSFDTECKILGNIRHRNLVKVITSCSNLDFKALVIEYMPNENLDKWFYSPDCAFSIHQRLQLMVDVASAIEYLHHGYSFPVVHCDLKPNNILLDEHMVAHVADFGISKLMMEDQRMEQTKTFGTIGYMAPEYGSSGLVSTMADIYSYGILLMETLTRKKPTHDQFSGELTMHKWVSDSYQNNLMQIIDVELLNAEDEFVKSNSEDCIRLIMELALQCSSHLPEERPNMKEVSARINTIIIKLNEKNQISKTI